MIHVEFEADKCIYQRCYVNHKATADCFENEWGGTDTDCDDYMGTDDGFDVDNNCIHASIEYRPVLVIGDFKKVVFEEDDCLTLDRKHYQLRDYDVHRLTINGKTYIPEAEEDT